MSQEGSPKKPMIRSLVASSESSKCDEPIIRNIQIPDLETALADNRQMWLDIVDPTSEELQWLAQQFDLSPAVTQDLAREDRRPALLVYPSYLFISLFEPYFDYKRIGSKEIHCIVTDHCFITVRHSDAASVENAYDRVAKNPFSWEGGIAYLLYLTAQSVIDTYYPLLDRISNQLNSLEEKLMEDGENHDDARQPIFRLKQQLINLRQMIAPQREVMSSVIGERRVTEHAETRDLFRHLYERLLRIYDVVDAQRDLASNVLDMIQNQESRKLMEAVNRLTIFSMIFLPLTFLSGLFELNFATTSNPVELPVSGAVMFIGVIGAMILSASVMTILFRQRGWI